MEPVLVHHFLVCRQATYDFNDPNHPYSLYKIVFLLRPPSGSTYPLLGTDLWVFVRLEAEDEHEFWVEVVRITGDDEFADELVVAYGPCIVPFGDDRQTLSRAWHRRSVPFPQSGIYEFRRTETDELRAAETISLEY